MKMRYFFLGLIILVACKKEPAPSTTPQIEFVSVSPATATEFTDPIVFTISYRDGDGDLGENDPNVSNCFVLDHRNDVVHKLRISQLAPSGDPLLISGELTVSLKNTAITNGATSQSATFSIYVKDRAGNISIPVVTTPITIVE